MSKRHDRIEKLSLIIDEIIDDWPRQVQTTVYGVRETVENFFREHGEYAWLKEAFNVRGIDSIVALRMVDAGYRKEPWGWMKPPAKEEEDEVAYYGS